MMRTASRRRFLRGAPLAAVAGFSGGVGGARGLEAKPEGFQVFKAEALAADARALQAAPGNNNLVTAASFTVVMTVETGQSAKEFEWHAGRDHVLQVLEGETVYEVGGTPEGGHSEKAGEWHAPVSAGATTLRLGKGDMLTVPRGTPHKRSTAGTVRFLLISAQGTV